MEFQQRIAWSLRVGRRYDVNDAMTWHTFVLYIYVYTVRTNNLVTRNRPIFMTRSSLFGRSLQAPAKLSTAAGVGNFIPCTFRTSLQGRYLQAGKLIAAQYETMSAHVVVIGSVYTEISPSALHVPTRLTTFFQSWCDRLVQRRVSNGRWV